MIFLCALKVVLYCWCVSGETCAVVANDRARSISTINLFHSITTTRVLSPLTLCRRTTVQKSFFINYLIFYTIFHYLLTKMLCNALGLNIDTNITSVFAAYAALPRATTAA